MDDRKSVLASTRRRAGAVAEKLDRGESELHIAERRLGTELYDNTARFTETVEAAHAERAWAQTAIAGLRQRRERRLRCD